jgi:hypothetical protein
MAAALEDAGIPAPRFRLPGDALWWAHYNRFGRGSS